MTSSNETSRNFRAYTWMAITLGLIVIAALLFLFVQVRTLDDKWGTIEANRESIEAQTNEWQDRRDKLDAEIKSREDNVLALRATIGGLEADAALLEQMRRELSQLEKKKQETEGFLAKNAGLQEQISEAQSTLEQLSGTGAALKKTFDNLNKETTSLRLQVAVLASERDELRSQRDTLGREVADLTSLRADVDNLTARRTQLNQELATMTSRNQQLDLERLKLEERVVSARIQSQTLSKNIGAAQERKTALETVLSGLSGAISEARTGRDTAEANRRRLESRANELSFDIKGREAQAKDAAERTKQAQADLIQVETQLSTQRAALAFTEARLAERARLLEEDRCA